MDKPVKMVVCDLDGTLLFNTHRITEYTKQTIRDLRKQGILFGICSGRSAVALRRLIRIWGIENDVDFVLGFNGGMFFEPGKEEMEEWLKLKKEDIPQIRRSFEGFPLGFAEYQGDKMLSTRRNPITRQMAKRNRLTFEKVPEEALEQDTSKFMAIGMPWVLNKWLRSGRKETLTNCRMFRSGPFLLEIVHPGLSKLEGIRKVARKYGIQLDEIVSFGNDNNDLEMLQGTVGVAMANALPAVKEVATFVTDSNRKDGVARFIRKNILKEDVHETDRRKRKGRRN